MSFMHRTVYDVFSFVRDMGGLVGGLNGLLFTLVSLLQFQDLHYFMISSLYRKESEEIQEVN